MTETQTTTPLDAALTYRGPTAEDLACFPPVLTALPQWVLFQLLEVPNTQGELKLTKKSQSIRAP